VSARFLPGALAAALLAAGLVAGSRVPWVAEPADRALVRLAWRADAERVEECREPSAAEQARTPAHMRQPRICERRLLPFRLVLRIDGRTLADELLHPSGAREDRPTVVFRDFPVSPGAHRLEIRFEAEPAQAAGRPALRLDETVALGPREILLVGRAPLEQGGGLRIPGGGYGNASSHPREERFPCRQRERSPARSASRAPEVRKPSRRLRKVDRDPRLAGKLCRQGTRLAPLSGQGRGPGASPCALGSLRRSSSRLLRRPRP
jgi:hypothetical protein